MIKIGQYNKLKINRLTDFGAYLDGGNGVEILIRSLGSPQSIKAPTRGCMSATRRNPNCLKKDNTDRNRHHPPVTPFAHNGHYVNLCTSLRFLTPI
mgnify:CR=1 FL=1